MKIEDYHHADCAQFRTPNIDFSSVEDALALALVRACERGHDPKTAIESILNDQKVVGTLVDQVAETLQFQEAAQLHIATSETEEVVRRYEEERREEVKGVEETFGKAAEEKKALMHATGKAAQEKSQAYSLAQSRLEELRLRVQSNLDELGGKKGYERLQTLRKEFSPSERPYPYAGMGWEEARRKEQEEMRLKGTGTRSYAEPWKKKEGLLPSSNPLDYSGSSYAGISVQKKSEIAKDPDLNVSQNVEPKNLEKNQGANLEETVKSISGESGFEKREISSSTALVKSEKGFWKKVWNVLNYKVW